MLETPSTEGLETLTTRLDELFAISLRDGLPVDPRAADLEELALILQAPFDLPEAPPELARTAVAVLAARPEAAAPSVLGAMAVLAHEPLAAEARAAITRAGQDDVVQVGDLRATEAVRIELGDEAVALGAMLERPGAVEARGAIVLLEREPCGGVVVEVEVTAASAPEEVRSVLLEPRPGACVEQVTVEALAREIGEALAHMRDHEVELALESATPLPLVERALTGSVGGWSRPDTAPPLDRAEREAAAAHRRADELVEAFAEHVEAEPGVDPLVVEHGPWVARAFLTYKIEYGDGELDRITTAELSDYLLEFAPRKGSSDEETLDATPRGLVGYLRFLAREDGLVGDVPVEGLVADVNRHAPQFAVASRDPRRWGPAKTMVEAMRSEGVELTDQEALDAWLDDFNSRPRAERDRVLGPMLDSPGSAAAPRKGRRGRNKAAKASRKRNRR